MNIRPLHQMNVRVSQQVSRLLLLCILCAVVHIHYNLFAQNTTTTGAQAASQFLPSIADTTLDIDDVRLAYKDKGRGQILLCLHAEGHSSKDFQSLYAGLPLDKFRIISIDFPEHGKSSRSNRAVSATYLRGLVQKFLEKLNLKNVVIIGNSIGGATAIKLAADNANVKGLALSNPTGLDAHGMFTAATLDGMIHFFTRGVQGESGFQQDFTTYYNDVLPSKEADARRAEICASASQIAPVLVSTWTSFKQKEEDLRPLIGKITCPVLFAWCMKDKYMQFERNLPAMQEFQEYQLVKYENLGHTPYVEQPEVFIGDVLKFLESL
ncbi:MAG: alpha/beta hydrolase [Candidatus Kapaibacterium sp.]|nr:MAG: alpha/beta hydrolase [Candidatus Kapabacteria bacterium]